MLVLLLGLTGCTQPQPISTASRTTVESPFARRTSTAIPANTVAPVSPATAHNPFATPVSTSTQLENATTLVSTATQTDGIPPTTVPTLVATLPPTPSLTPTASVAIKPKTATPLNNEQRWRMQQDNREVLTPPRLYTIQGEAALLWYDPLTSQTLALGFVRGSVPAQALFVFRPDQATAIEVPYRINVDFGLTSVSDVVVERMRQAGYTESVESFIILTDKIQAQN